MRGEDAIAENRRIFKIQGTILGFLERPTSELFAPCFSCSFSSRHSVQETEATSVSSAYGRMHCCIR